MTYNIPNTLTMFRIALIPCLVLIYYIPEQSLSIEFKNLIATTVFVVAAITDWLDGYLARKLKQTSKFGAFIDPVADKLIRGRPNSKFSGVKVAGIKVCS